MPAPLDYRRPQDDPPPVTSGEWVLAMLVAVVFIGFFLLIALALFSSMRR